MLPLPIDPILPAVIAAVQGAKAAVVTAAPGSGKSTRVPPALLGTVTGQIYLLQPRRIAAKTLARRIAQENGWTLGKEVGYRVRFEKVGGKDTRLWVMTEGSLTRQLADDPYLEGVGAVILDEFHERSLHTDLAMGYLRELQKTLRPDLALVVMSATLDATGVAAFLGDAPVLDAPGRTFPVTTRNAPFLPDTRLEQAVAQAVAEAAALDDAGDILVFLPGMGEIRWCQRAVEDLGLDRDVLPLHGSLPPEEQDRALAPSPRGKVVLSTNVAETSVTIPGVRTVIDTGTARVNRFNAATGLDELRLEPVSRASLTQRAGRAGRTAPGRCIRLTSPLVDARRDEHQDPEIARVDLAGTLLALKAWGYPDTRTFPWFEAPDTERLEAAEDLLALLGATTAPHGALTPLGTRLAGLPVHPRLGRLLYDAQAAGVPDLGAALAAITGERDLKTRSSGVRGPGSGVEVADAVQSLALLRRAEEQRFHPGLRSDGIEPNAAREVAKVRDDLLRLLGPRGTPDPGPRTPDDLIPRLLLAAYPDRVAKRAAPDANRGMMVGGVAVDLDEGSVVAARRGQTRSDLFLCVAVQGVGQGLKASTQVRQAAELTEEDLEAVFPGSIRRQERLTWDDGRGVVEASVGWAYRDLVIRMARGAQADPAAVAALLADRLGADAAGLLAAHDEAGPWLQRYRWLQTIAPDLALPDLPLAEVVREACAGCRSRAEVLAKPLKDWLTGRLDWNLVQRIEALAPATYEVPSGSRMRLDYSNATPEQPPILAVRLQELFGLATSPSIVDGRVRLLLHLQGPNYRTEQVTRDLVSFWANTYPQVRKDLRGRYPKHSWPEDPLTAQAVCKGRPTKG